MSKSKEDYVEMWFIEHNDHHVDDNFRKLFDKIGEKIKNEKSKRIGTT